MDNNYKDVKNKIGQLWWKVKDGELKEGFEDFLEYFNKEKKELFRRNNDELMLQKYKRIEEVLEQFEVDLKGLQKRKKKKVENIEVIVELLYDELLIDENFPNYEELYNELREELLNIKMEHINAYSTFLKGKLDYVIKREENYRIKKVSEIVKNIEIDKTIYINDIKKKELLKKRNEIIKKLIGIEKVFYTKEIKDFLIFIKRIDVNNNRIKVTNEKLKKNIELKRLEDKRKEDLRIKKEIEEKRRAELKKEVEENKILETKRKEARKKQREEKKRLDFERKEKLRKEKEEEEDKYKNVVKDLNLDEILNLNYLNSLENIEKKLIEMEGVTSKIYERIIEKYEKLKITFIQNWVFENTKNKLKEGISLDDEQAKAVGEFGKNYLVSARAGSGKTRVLISRAYFLIKHCNVLPNEILLLVFNKKAEEEIIKRLKKLLKNEIPIIKTFHALAHKIVESKEKILFDNENDKIHSEYIDKLIKKFIRKKENLEEMKNIMLMDFGDEWKILLNSKYISSPEEILQYKRSLIYEGLDGKSQLNSYGEKVIFDFLFEHNINFFYEKNNSENNLKYRSCFTVKSNNEKIKIAIEFIEKEESKLYNGSYKKQTKYRNKNGWSMIEIYQENEKIKKNLIEKKLIEKIEGYGIKLKKLTEKEIWEKIKDPLMEKFVKVITSFIGKCRKKEIKVEDLKRIIRVHEVKNQFYPLCLSLYSEYLKSLKKDKVKDFDGLLEEAIEKIKLEKIKFIEKTKYIFIDEFQDFSKLFYSLIKAMEKTNKPIELFCVGDNWQAINGFAGSDLDFFTNFENKFKNNQYLKMSKNYRSKQGIVDIGNKLQFGNGYEAKSQNKEEGNVKVVHMNNFEPTSKEIMEYGDKDSITPIILRIVNKNINLGKKVMLINRTNIIPYYIESLNSKNKQDSREINNFLKLIKSKLPEEKQSMVKINTTHKSKGLEEEVVILLDVNERRYPLIHPNWKYNRLLGDSIEKIIEEEKRLLYVGLTRAEESLYLITGGNNKSQFLRIIEKSKKMEEINFLDYPPIENLEMEKRKMILRIKDSFNENVPTKGTRVIKDILKDYKYNYKEGKYLWEKIVKENNFNIESILKEDWVKRAREVNITLIDEEDKEIEKLNIDANGKIRKI